MNKDIITESKLQKRWGALLDAGDRIRSAQTRKVLAQVFENTYNDFVRQGLITEATPPFDHAAPGQQGNVMGAPRLTGADANGFMTGRDSGQDGVYTAAQGNDFYMPNVIMPMLRRIFPDLIANELVGVQPLNGPVGIALALRAQYKDTVDNAGWLGDGQHTLSDEIAFNSPDTSYTGISGQELADDLSDYYGIDGDETATADRKARWAGTGRELGVDSEFASFSQGTYPTASFGLMKATVTAKTRKLGGQWSPELAEDMQAVHGIDVENEMVNILSYEIGAEIDRQILTEMVKAAITGNNKTTWTPEKADGLDQMGRLHTLLTLITVVANDIAIRTRRGAGNFVVASPRVCAVLEQLGMNKFISMSNSKAVPSVPYSGVGALQKQGLINDGQQLLVRDAYAGRDYVLVGYKGQHPGDSGIVYCPYIPVSLSKAINPDTMTPVIGCRTRYGLMNSVWDSSRYYSFIGVGGLFEGYQFSTANRTFLGVDSLSTQLPR